MTAKQFLNRARRIDREITQSLDLYQHTRDRLTSVTQSLEGVNVSGTKDPHKFDSLVELKDTIDHKVDELVRVKAEIFRAVTALPDRNQRLVLISYYLDMNTWEQTAVNMGYTYQHIVRIRKRAYIELEKKLELTE